MKMRKRTPLWLFPALALALACTGGAGAQIPEVPLSLLLQPGSMIQCEDKWFFNFVYATFGPDMAQPENVLVECIGGPNLPGLGFSIRPGTPLWQDSMNDGVSQFAIIGYTLISHGNDIIDNHLSGDPFVLPDPNTGLTDGTAAVLEDIFDLDGNGLGQKLIFDSVNLGVRQMQPSDSARFPPQQGLIVVKTLSFDNRGGIPVLGQVNQTFSQVPEPGAVGMLVGLGLGGGLFVLRLRRR